MAGNIFEIYSSNQTFWYIETLINKNVATGLHKQLYYK